MIDLLVLFVAVPFLFLFFFLFFWCGFSGFHRWRNSYSTRDGISISTGQYLSAFSTSAILGSATFVAGFAFSPQFSPQEIGVFFLSLLFGAVFLGILAGFCHALNRGGSVVLDRWQGVFMMAIGFTMLSAMTLGRFLEDILQLRLGH